MLKATPNPRTVPEELRTDPTVKRGFTGHKEPITSISFKPTLTHLASGSIDGTVMLWNFKPQHRALKFVGHLGAITSVDFSPNSQILASSSVDKTVRLWSPTVNGQVTVFNAHTCTVRSIQFSTDGQTLLSCSDDKSIKIWSTLKTKFQGTLLGHMNWVRTARFSPDSRLVVSGSDDKTVKLWDLRLKSCIRTYSEHLRSVSSVAFHPSASVIASASFDGTIKLYDLRTHRLIQHYEDVHKDQNGMASVNSIAFGGLASEWLISTGVDGTVKIWDLKEGHLFYTLHGHKNGPTTAAQFSPDSEMFATGGSDHKVILWNSNFKSCLPEKNINEPVDIYINVSDQSLPIESKQPESHDETKTTKTNYETQTRNGIEPKSGMDKPSMDIETQPSMDSFDNDNDVQHSMKHNNTIEMNAFKGIERVFSTSIETMTQQIEILTQTMAILESRLTQNEDSTRGVESKLDFLIKRLVKDE